MARKMEGNSQRDIDAAYSNGVKALAEGKPAEAWVCLELLDCSMPHTDEEVLLSLHKAIRRYGPSGKEPDGRLMRAKLSAAFVLMATAKAKRLG